MGAVLAAAVLICGIMISLTVIAVNTKDKPAESEEKAAIAYQYVLKDYENRLAVFNWETEKLIKVYDEVLINTLPEPDQEALKKGISVKNDAELQKLIEDYTG